MHFVHHFRDALLSYIASAIVWFILLWSICFSCELLHRVIQFANIRLGTLGMYLSLALLATLVALCDENRLLSWLASTLFHFR